MSAERLLKRLIESRYHTTSTAELNKIEEEADKYIQEACGEKMCQFCLTYKSFDGDCCEQCEERIANLKPL